MPTAASRVGSGRRQATRRLCAGLRRLPDPYPDEKPILTINDSNWKEYENNLTTGTQAMFEKYGADGWEMQVYPTTAPAPPGLVLRQHRKKTPPVPIWSLTARKSRATTGRTLSHTPVRPGSDLESHDQL